MMGYNTRRKSLSLPSLGISVPGSSSSSTKSSPSKSQSPPTDSSSSSSSSAAASEPPSKRLKQRHNSPHPLSNVETPKGRYGAAAPLSPPPSDGEDAEDSGDEIVNGVIEVLRKSGNRPHTVKELAVLLMRIIPIVENSANPHAIISSRLNAYLKRGWPAGTKCKLAKELITTHPRRIYFYLTTQPALPIPTQEQVAEFLRQSMISPALSEDEEEERHREESPEVDLSLDEDDSASQVLDSPSKGSGRILVHHRRIMSPPLEGDEQEFTQSAINIRHRRMVASRAVEEQQRLKRSREEAEIQVKQADVEGELLGTLEPQSPAALTDDEVVFPHVAGEAEKHDGNDAKWGVDLRSPESMGLDELEGLLDEDF